MAILNFLGLFLFVVYTIALFAVGYTVGYNNAIDDMKKVRTKK